jgi:uncharacterized protein
MGTFYENNQMSLDKTKLSGNIRNSSYTISVKLEAEEDKYMLLHGYTGAIDIVNENVINYLDNVNNPGNKNVEVSESTFNALKARGYLTEKTKEEEVAFVRKFANLLHQKDKKLHKGFLFLVAYDCNFRCPYCYESTVLKNSRQWTKKAFSKEMVDRAYEAMLKIEPNRKLHSPRIGLYGGEPLLASNKEIVTYIVQKGIALGYDFTAITNGYDLDAFKELLGPGKISSMQITVDGLKETHNRRRIHFRTGESFDRILDNIGMALKQGVSVSVRVNTDAINFNELPQLEQIFKESGYTEYPKFSMNSAIVFNYGQAQGKDINFLSQTGFEQKHKNISYKYQCSGVTLLARMLYKTIKKQKRIHFSPTYCSAQRGMYILDPFGEIYSCWENVGMQDLNIGKYLSDTIEWTNILNLWHSQNIVSSDKCVNCRYAFFCKGGCPSRGAIQNDKFGSGFCNSFPVTFEHAVNLAYHQISKES